MRFTLLKDLRQDKAIKPLLNGLLLFMLMYFIADFFVVNATLGLFPSDIKLTLYGNIDEFIDPIDKSVFLEYIHGQIFFMMMILLTLSAVFARLIKKSSFSIFIINALMITALATLVTLGLSYFSSQAFISAYITLFELWHIVALYMTLHSLWRLNLAKSI